MKILFIGDIFGRVGRRAITEVVSKLKKEKNINLVIANAENATHGRSLNYGNYLSLTNAGVDYITMGNHTYDTTDFFETLEKTKKVIRPYNIDKTTKEGQVGQGSIQFIYKNKKIRITNLVSVFCLNHFKATNPFLAFEQLVKQFDDVSKPDIHIVDYHCESTSEKRAFLLAYSKYVSAILGTHTHVPTADEHIYNKSTFFQTDVGMTGPIDSIIGAKKEEIIEMFQQKRNKFKMEPATGRYQFNAVILEFNDETNKPVQIERLNIIESKK